jgi:16S rRNA (guanine966-N2)-methyltransferase
MRVIAGTLRGRRLTAPRGLDIRPTGDRLKETLFNILRPRIDGARFLDAFSGTGAIGIEALSRGATSVVFIDSNESGCRALRRNLEHCGISGGFRLLKDDIFTALRRLVREGECFDILFLDPPYDWGPHGDLLEEMVRSGLASAGSLIVIEHHRRAPLPDQGPGYRRTRKATQGDHCLSFYSVVLPDPASPE